MAKVKNWSKFQHYKNRCPPWIKLQKELLDDYEFACLPIASKALAPLLWLLASESLEGDFEAHPTRLAFRLRWPVSDIIDGLIPLIKQGFIVDASEALAECLQGATPETETETEAEAEKSKIKNPPSASSDPKGEIFTRWKSVPGSGGGAFLVKLLRDHKPEQRVLEAIEATLAETRADPKAYVLGVLAKGGDPTEKWKQDPDSAPWAGAL